MKRKSQLQVFKNWIIYRALIAASAAGRRPSLKRSRSIGRSIGGLAYRVLPRERRRARQNLERALPQLSAAERDSIMRGMFLHLGESLFEIFWLPNLSEKNFAETTRIEGLENMRRAVDAGKGVVLFTGHCGNWEWMAASIAMAGLEMNVIARELYDPRINDFVVASRMRHGVKTIGRGSTSSAREIIATLRRGAILGVLIDQNIKAETSEIRFFGIPAATPTGPAKLAIRAGSMAIAGFIERRDGVQYIRFLEPVQTDRGMDPVALTERMTQAIEDQIRRVPEQWVWMHRRWGKG